MLSHPTIEGSLVCMVAGTDISGSDLVARIFAVRTGVPVSYEIFSMCIAIVLTAMMISLGT